MKKIGIITLIGYFNYGNRLQNYASQEVLKSLGYEVETVINHSVYNKFINKFIYKTKKYGLKAPIIFVKKFFISLARKDRNKEYKILLEKKIKRFKEFTSNYILESDYKIYKDDIQKLNHEKYYKFITGSDQVWNPNFTSGGDLNTFLGFAPKNKRVAYSPSFGVSNLNEKQKKIYTKWLNEMDSLSCREQAGADLIYKLTKRKAEVLVDPTMMLTKEKWQQFSKPQEGKTSKKYLLTYFLGPISDEDQKKINSVATENNLEIINLCDEKSPEIYIADPTEWVDYIKYAEIFCTDSFHGVVFSILMETPFAVYNRSGKIASMNSRIDTILSKFKLENRKAENVFRSKNYFNVNFDHCADILEAERKKAISYLKKALENE